MREYGGRPTGKRGSDEREVSGASTEVMAVAMERMGPECSRTPSASVGLSRPIASENSPICGIDNPTRSASSRLRPDRIEPTIFAMIFPAMNTPTTTSAGTM